MDKSANLKYELQTLSSYEASDLDNPEFEVLYESIGGEEGFATVCCIDIGKRSLDRIEELELHLKQTLDNSISQASDLRDRIAELEKALRNLLSATDDVYSNSSDLGQAERAAREALKDNESNHRTG